MSARTSDLRRTLGVRLKGDTRRERVSAAAHPEAEETDPEPHQGEPGAQRQHGNLPVRDGGAGPGGDLAGGVGHGRRGVVRARRIR